MIEESRYLPIFYSPLRTITKKTTNHSAKSFQRIDNTARPELYMSTMEMIF
jgi:hypothetical protein